MKSIVVAVPRVHLSAPAPHKRYSPVVGNIRYFFRRYGLISFFITILFVGMISGAVRSAGADSDIPLRISSIIIKYFGINDSNTPIRLFTNSFTISFVFISAIFILSLSPLGILFIPSVLFIRGFEYGLISGSLCIIYGFKGLAYYIVVILLGAFISSLAIIYAAQYCTDFSVSVLLTMIGKSASSGAALKEKLKETLLSCAYMLILIVLSSLVDTALYYLIGVLFSF